MTVTYTWDVYSTLDGFASYNEDGDWEATGATGANLDYRSKVLNQLPAADFGKQTPFGSPNVNAWRMSRPTT